MLSRRRVTDYVARQIMEGSPVDAAMQSLAAYLITTKQTGQADRYVADLESALARHGRTVVDVTTARPIDETLRERIASLVGGAADIREHVDPELIGGIIIKTPESVLDASVRTQLRELRTS